MVATDALSRARIPGTSSTGLEMTGTAGVGVFVAEEWIGKVFEVQRVSNRIILVKLIFGQHVNTILCVNAPYLTDENKQSIGPNRHSIGDDTSSW